MPVWAYGSREMWASAAAKGTYLAGVKLSSRGWREVESAVSCGWLEPYAAAAG